MPNKPKKTIPAAKKTKITKNAIVTTELIERYGDFFNGITKVLEEGRRLAARSVNAILTATYWEVGRHIVEEEQGTNRTEHYGKNIVERLSTDLSSRFGRGFSYRNLWTMRKFYLVYPPEKILQTLSAESNNQQPLQDVQIS
jgi:hypothetical protein